MICLTDSLSAQNAEGEPATESVTEAVAEPFSELGAYSDYFTQAANFSLGFVRFSPRALLGYSPELRLNGVVINDPQTNTPPWGALGSMLSIPTVRGERFGIPFSMSQTGIGGVVGGEYLNFEPLTERAGGKAVAALSNRTYTYRLSAAYTLHTRNDWGVTIDASRRWGRSMTTFGVWTDAWNAFAAAEKRLNAAHTLQLTFMIAPTERATAAPATDEAFALANDNLYNPSWGLWDGEQRSTRTRQNFEPMAIVGHEWRLGEGLTLKNALFVRTGRASRSGMSWQNAPNPRPDYWAAMPSAQATPEAAAMVADLWRNDVTARQINFDQMVTVNELNAPRARYMIEDKVREMSQITLQSSVFGRNFSGGVSLTGATSLNYKEMADLLGADYWLDVDSFVEMDDDVKELTQNNLRDPNRHIAVGDRFGYNYRLNTFSASAWGAYAYQTGRWTLTAGANIAPRADQRVGYYEKENFASGRSYGASESFVVLDATAKLTARYAVGQRFALDMAVGYEARGNTSEKQFISITTRNAQNPERGATNIFSAEASATYRTSAIRASASLFYAATAGGNEMVNIYDDLRHCYVHYSMRGVNTASFGLHGAAEFELPFDLSTSVAVALQSSRYTTNPTATEYRETTGEVVATDQTVLYKGLGTGLAPSAAGVVSLSYRPYGWVVSLSAVWAAGSVALPSPVRRTYDALSAAASNEAIETMQSQEELPAWITIDLFAGRTWYFNGLKNPNQSLGLYVGANNLLNNREIKTVGYESSRLRNVGTSYAPALVPHDTKYYHGLGVNFFVNMTYRF